MVCWIIFSCPNCIDLAGNRKEDGSWCRRMMMMNFSVAYVSRSGGMSNELNNIIARHSDGVYEGIAIGGDRYFEDTRPILMSFQSISGIQERHLLIIFFDLKMILKRK